MVPSRFTWTQVAQTQETCWMAFSFQDELDEKLGIRKVNQE